jgi:6-phosphogluconolactonase
VAGPNVEILPPSQLHQRAADVIAEAISASVARAGRCAIALSGGTSPAETFRCLAAVEVEWSSVDVFQVDERVAPDGHPDRNLVLIERELIRRIEGVRPRLHPMPVTEGDLDAAARRYETELERVCGRPPVIDVVHLGLGPDGHLASLVPNDPVLDVADRWVVATRTYAGYRRMTLTFPVLEAAGKVLFVVTGDDKRDALRQMLAGDPSVPASRLIARDIVVLTDAEVSLP